MGKMTVYHGSYTAIEHPQIIVGRNTKDFGPGFYCTMIREQALSYTGDQYLYRAAEYIP